MRIFTIRGKLNGKTLIGPLIILVLVWRKSIHFWRRYAQ